MTKVTREMIAAAHDITMQHKIMLGHELLTEIYQAMDAKREFVGLTDEEERELAAIASRDAIYSIEAKLKNKNGY